MIVELLQNSEIQTATEDTIPPIWLLILGSSLVTSIATVFVNKFFEFQLKNKDLRNQVAKELFHEKLKSLRQTMEVFNELRLSEEVRFNGKTYMNLAIFSSRESLTLISQRILSDLNEHFHKPKSIEEPLAKLYYLITLLGRKALSDERLNKNIEVVGWCASQHISKIRVQLHDACISEMDRVMKKPSESLKLATGFIETDFGDKAELAGLEDLSNEIIENVLTILEN